MLISEFYRCWQVCFRLAVSPATSRYVLNTYDSDIHPNISLSGRKTVRRFPKMSNSHFLKLLRSLQMFLPDKTWIWTLFLFFNLYLCISGFLLTPDSTTEENFKLAISQWFSASLVKLIDRRSFKWSFWIYLLSKISNLKWDDLLLVSFTSLWTNWIWRLHSWSLIIVVWNHVLYFMD